jgi:hypothetical protein
MKKCLAIFLLVSSSAHAGFLSGNKLLEYMNAEPEWRMFAMGYVAGVHDAGDKAVFCSPDSIKVGQTRDIVKVYLETHPAERHELADTLILRVLKQHYPCKRGTSS